LHTGLGLRSNADIGKVVPGFGRSQIVASEMDSMKTAFRRETGSDADRLPRVAVLGLVKSLPGYEAISQKEYDYVLVEAGLADRDDVDVNEFVEVGSSFLCMLSASDGIADMC
jgi:glycerol-3-phosphate dehydrogenase